MFWRTSGSHRPSVGRSSREICSGPMEGSYQLKANGAKTTVRYTLTVDVNMPMIGMFKRKAEKTIIDGALDGLKKKVEG
jgi:hypothetical protein